MFGKKAGSVIDLKFVLCFYNSGLIKVLGLFFHFFAKHHKLPQTKNPKLVS